MFRNSFLSLLFILTASHCGLCVQNVRCTIIDRGWIGLSNIDKTSTACYIERFPYTDPRQKEFDFVVDYTLPGDIKWVEFDTRNVVEYIPKSIFTEFPTMRTLIMTTNVSELNPGDFDHANTLEELRLSNNNIKIIKYGVFSRHPISLLNNDDVVPFKRLKYLFVDKNEIYEIEDNSFEGLTELTGLTLTRNKLSFIKERTFAGLLNLHTLALDNNDIATIESGALDMPGLTNLILRSNRLTHLPDSIFSRLPSLQYLHLDHNKLNRLTDNLFDGLSRLSYITLQYNDLEHIGQSLYRPPYLYDITLRANRIEDIDLIAFAHMPGLLALDLAESGFTFATVDIKNEELWHSFLWYLDLSKNNLSNAIELNKLRMFPNVSLLVLDGNPFKDLEIGGNRTLKHIIPSLKTLQVNGTDIGCEYLLDVNKRYRSVNVNNVPQYC